MTINKNTIEDLGFNDFFKAYFANQKSDGFRAARVIAEHKGLYEVKNDDGDYLAKVTGKIMFEASSREDYPAVGDWVMIKDLDGEHATIHSILPRKTLIKRSAGENAEIIAANIDVAFIVESIDRDYNLNRFERYTVIAKQGGVKPIIILNKIDLISKEELVSKLNEIKNRFKEVEIVSVSSLSGEGLQELKKHIKKGKTYCFLGSSGVGKSSLINNLIGKDIIKTDEIGHGTNRGKHTTTSREMYFLENGGILIDNPGMREIGMTETGGIENFFDEISCLATKCKFADCTHLHEPGCEVLSALNSGKLDPEKYANYINLKKEAEYFELTELEKREKDRQFGKFLKTAKKQLRKKNDL